MKKQKENSHEGITWSETGKQNVQAEKVYLALNLDVNRSTSGVKVMARGCSRISVSNDRSKLHEKSLEKEATLKFSFPGMC